MAYAKDRLPRAQGGVFLALTLVRITTYRPRNLVTDPATKLQVDLALDVSVRDI